MRNDKEFKSKVRDESYIKDKRPDVRLGRHTDIVQNKPTSQSKKNRMYQARQEPQTETAAVNPETPYTEDMQTDLSEPEPQEEFSETAELEQPEAARDISKSEPPEQTPKTKRRLYRKHTQNFQKSVKSDIPQLENNPVTSEPPPPTKTDDYNIRDVVRDSKTEFSRNTDMNFSETAADRDSNISFDRVNTSDKSAEPNAPLQSKRKQRRYSRDSKQADTSKTDFKAEQSADDGKSPKKDNSEAANNGDVPFDRVTRFDRKAEKARAKADKAEQKLPHKTKIKRQRIFDEQKQKPKNHLQFEKEVKPQSDLYHRSPVRLGVEILQYKAASKIHSKIAEAEGDNTAVEAAHKTEQKAETLSRYSMRTVKHIDGQRKAAPYKKAARLKHRAEKAEVKAIHERTLAENPQLKKSVLKKFQQKQRIKKQYQKAKQAEQSAKAAKKTAQNTERALRRFIAFIWRHKAVFGIILAIALLIAWLGTVLSSCSVMLTTGANSIMVSSYFAEDEDIYAAENYYVSLEQDLQSKVNRIESDYPGYDEYNYSMAQIGHNPYELISYLTAVYQDFKFNDIKLSIDTLFNSQYHLTVTAVTEQREDEDGNDKEYKILNVTLTNEGMTNSLTDEQRELYNIYLVSKGNRDYLFANDIYANESDAPSYTIPGEALTDATFRRLITEAEKYLGFPYVWGGSSPSTSFDCSGFVCWVFQNSGIYPLSRTTAQGIYNQCARVSPQDAKPGDIIFFKGTYNTSEVSHVGIYVGNGMMIHAGNPIQYTSVNTNYWTQHFFAYGRLGGN